MSVQRMKSDKDRETPSVCAKHRGLIERSKLTDLHPFLTKQHHLSFACHHSKSILLCGSRTIGLMKAPGFGIFEPKGMVVVEGATSRLEPDICSSKLG